MTSNHLKTSLYTLAATAMLLSSSQNHAQQYYKWVDASGSTHYTATPPPKGAKRLDKVTTYGSHNYSSSNPTSTTTQPTQTPQSDINQQHNSSTTNMPTDNSRSAPTAEAPSVSSNSGVKVQPKL